MPTQVIKLKHTPSGQYLSEIYHVTSNVKPFVGIPDICHFFTREKFLENKIYTEKRQFFALNL